jgi:hypothetical protein
MIYDTNQDYIWFFLSENMKFEKKWEKKFGARIKAQEEHYKNSRKEGHESYIDMINNNTIT